VDIIDSRIIKALDISVINIIYFNFLVYIIIVVTIISGMISTGMQLDHYGHRGGDELNNFGSGSHLNFTDILEIRSNIFNLSITHDNVEKMVKKFYLSILDLVISMLVAFPDRKHKLQAYERTALLSIYVHDKFGIGFKTSELSLSDYLKTKDAKDQLPNACTKVFNLFSEIGKYYDSSIFDSNIRKHLKNKTFCGENFRNLVAKHVLFDTLGEISENAGKLKYEKSKRILTIQPQSSSTGILTNGVVSDLNMLPEDEEEERESVTFGDVVAYSVLQGPFNKTELDSLARIPPMMKLKENALRYQLKLFYFLCFLSNT